MARWSRIYYTRVMAARSSRWLGISCALAGALLVAPLGACSDGAVNMPADMAPATSPLIEARPYQVELPDSAQRPAPLVVVLHGFSANGITQDAYFGFSNFARAQGVITAFPDGNKNSQGQRFWNATDDCCDRERTGVDDVAYLTAVIDDAIARYGADPKRVYLLGHSNGGFMSYRMACDRADRVAAIASLAGSNWRETSRCKPAAEVAVLQMHGTKDDAVPYQPLARDSAAFFAQVNGCGAAPEAGAARDLDGRLDGAETQVLRWPSCRKGGVELWTIQEGVHLPNLNKTFAQQVYGFLSQFHR